MSVGAATTHLGILKQRRESKQDVFLWIFQDEEFMRMELLYKTTNFLYDSLHAATKEETQILKMILVGLTTALVTISTLSYDRMGGPKPKGKGCTNWETILMATTAGTLAAVYTSYFQ